MKHDSKAPWILFFSRMVLCGATLLSVEAFGQTALNKAAVRSFKASPSYFVGNVAHGKTGEKLVADNDVVAFIQTQQGRVLFTPCGAFIGMRVSADDSDRDGIGKSSRGHDLTAAIKTVVLKSGFSASHGKKRAVTPHLAEPTHHIVSFMKGPREHWQTGLTTYRTLVYDQVWDGITLEYLAYQDRLEYRLVLEPGSNPSNIVMETGAEQLEVLEDGGLLAHLAGGTLRISRPIAYQEIEGQRIEIDVAYAPMTDGRYRFDLADYDPTQELIIDPELTWSTYLGGPGGAGTEQADSIAVDASGNAYVTGATPAGDWPATIGSFDDTWNGGSQDAFVAKIDATGTVLSYATYLGGSAGDKGKGIAVDDSGNAYITGETSSSDFPTTAGAYDQTIGFYGADAFVCKLNSTGTALVYSTFLGGSSSDSADAIAVDGSGNAIVVGGCSVGFPTTTGVFDASYNGGGEAFVSKISADGSALIFSTFVGGSGSERAYDVVLDSSENIHFVGQTTSSDFPTTSGAIQETSGGSQDAFIGKLSSDASTLIYGSYIGGSGADGGYGITVDGSDQAYVTGNTRSTDFPTTPGAYDTYFPGYNSDAFVCKLNAAGTAFEYATFLGEGYLAIGYSIAVDGSGQAVVAGYAGPDFPTTNGAFSETCTGQYDAFVTQLNATGSDLVFSTFFGGSGGGNDEAKDVALDGSGNVYISGGTGSYDLPGTSSGFDGTLGGATDPFVAKLNSTGTAVTYATYLGGTGDDDGTAVAVDTSGNAYVTGSTWSDGFPTTAGAFDESHNLYRDVFVSKINADGTELTYSTFIGGTSSEFPRGIALDSATNAYVTGVTQSNDFPATGGAFDETHNGAYDVFALKLNTTGTGLSYSTFLGGPNYEEPYDIDVDDSGNAYIAGSTDSGFPTTSGAFDVTHNGGDDVFVSKLNDTGSALVYSTFIGASDYEEAHGIDVDASGNAFITGATRSADFPTTVGAYNETNNGYYDAFVVKLNDSGTDLVYSTFLGGASTEMGRDIAVNTVGNAFVAGYSTGNDFPVTSGAFDDTKGGYSEGFIAKLNPSGTDLVYSTYLGGSDDDHVYGIALDNSGFAYLTGRTDSTDFPVTPGAEDVDHNGDQDAFLAKINHSGQALLYGTFWGTDGVETASDVAVYSAGIATIVGTTDSAAFPTTAGAYDGSQPGNGDAFVSQFDLRCVPGPLAWVSGDAGICPGGDTTIQARLGGTPPWDVTWSDGLVQNGLVSSPVTRVVSPASTTVYTVTAFNDSVCSGISDGSATVTVVPPPAQPGAISGNEFVCANDIGENYSIAAVPDATDYTWTVPTGAVITSGQGSIAITVDFGATSGDVSVIAENACDASAPRTLAVTVNPRPTATVSGDANICAGDAAPIEAALTGIGPWDLSWSDGVDQLGVAASPASRDVSPASTTVYSVTSVSDTLCTNTGTGSATVTIIPLPTATVSGGGQICLGDMTSVQADLTGTPPWNVTWSDGTPYLGVMVSPLIHDVSPLASFFYTVTDVEDANCTGTASGQATVVVRLFGVDTDPPKAIAQGEKVLYFTAWPVCDTPPTELEWTIPATGYSFGTGTNPIALDPIPTETTIYQIRVTDTSNRATVTRQVVLLVATDPIYLDFNGDGCNNVEDLWGASQDWLSEFPALNDPNGDGTFNLLDTLYINTDDPYPCP